MNNLVGSTLCHKFYKWEIDLTTMSMDICKLFYYDRANAFDMPDPDN